MKLRMMALNEVQKSKVTAGRRRTAWNRIKVHITNLPDAQRLDDVALNTENAVIFWIWVRQNVFLRKMRPVKNRCSHKKNSVSIFPPPSNSFITTLVSSSWEPLYSHVPNSTGMVWHIMQYGSSKCEVDGQTFKGNKKNRLSCASSIRKRFLHHWMSVEYHIENVNPHWHIRDAAVTTQPTLSVRERHAICCVKPGNVSNST